LYKVLAILPKELGAGFALTGMDVRRVTSNEDAETTLAEVVDDEQYGLIVVDESLTEEMDQRTLHRYMERNVPLIIPIPAQLIWQDIEEVQQDDYVAKLIRHAVGYQLNIQL
jgi:vacuolar-type H+-ATPase subunit F/Vma7